MCASIFSIYFSDIYSSSKPPVKGVPWDSLVTLSVLICAGGITFNHFNLPKKPPIFTFYVPADSFLQKLIRKVIGSFLENFEPLFDQDTTQKLTDLIKVT